MNKDWYFIDIHAHILPGVDDGAADMAETLEMIGTAYEQGVRAIVATPHYGAMNPDYDREKVAAAYRETYNEVKKRWPDMLLMLGNEMFYGTMALEDMQHGKANTMAGSDYVLVEFYPDVTYNEIERAMRNMIQAGFKPVLAHVERYMCLEKELDLVEDLIRQGVYIQVNARSLMRKRFDRVGKWVKMLLKNELIHFVATDCHNNSGRAPNLADAVEKLLTMADENTVRDLVWNNGLKMLKNQLI